MKKKIMRMIYATICTPLTNTTGLYERGFCTFSEYLKKQALNIDYGNDFIEERLQAAEITEKEAGLLIDRFDTFARTEIKNAAKITF